MRAESVEGALAAPVVDRNLSEPQAGTPEGLAETRRIFKSVARRCAVSLTAANLVGGILVYLLSVYVIPSPHVDDVAALNRLNLIVVGPMLVAGLVLGTALSLRMARRSSGWLLEGRDPTPAELDGSLNFPKRQALMEAGLWGCAVVVFSVLNGAHSLTLGVECAIEVGLAGLTTVALTYLLDERISRPVFALALERTEHAPSGAGCPSFASRLTVAWLVGAMVPLVAVLLVGVTAIADIPASRDRIGLAVVLLASVGAVVGLVVIVVAGRTLTEPLTALRGALHRVEQGDLAASVQVDDASEIGRLQSGFNRMVSGLRERDRLLDLFGRQVGEEVAREALERDGVELGGETREAAVLFVDLIGSTALASHWEPQAVVARLNEFFSIVVDCVSMHGGWVNKFEGDAALCVFGAPTSHPDAAGAALSTARLLRSRLDRDLPDVRAAIGVSAGTVVAGNVGTATRYEYTVIGDPVNEAARLTDLAKSAPELLLASKVALERARNGERARWRTGEPVTLRGRDRETVVAAPV